MGVLGGCATAMAEALPKSAPSDSVASRMDRAQLASVWPPDASARVAGHRPMSPIEAIRRKCLDCSCHKSSEVKLCEAVACPLWPFRADRHPYTKDASRSARVEVIG